MISRTIYIGSEARLSLKLGQLVINLRNAGGRDEVAGINTIPIEDIGVLVLDNPQISITQALLSFLLESSVAVISCNEMHLPNGMFYPLKGNTLLTERVRYQIEASEPLKKNLWKQVVTQKILNQAEFLKINNIAVDNMAFWAKNVTSGDSKNHEGRAAAYYWPRIFSSYPGFIRGRFEEEPNNLLNYVYAIIRATMARSITISGLLPVLGIHHRNKYNPYCLADDLMEPYRIMGDMVVSQIILTGKLNLDKENKSALFKVLQQDVWTNGTKSPLMVAIQQTANSLYKCFVGDSRKLILPEIYANGKI